MSSGLPKGRLTNWILLLACCLGLFLRNDNSIVIAQELPENAIWRFGEFGKSSDDNGYYRLLFSPNGKLLAARNRSNFLEIYDVETRKQLCQIEGDDALINTIDFSPDSKWFLTTCFGEDEKVRIWSTQTGALKHEIDVASAYAFFSENGEDLIVFGEKSVETFNIQSGKRTSQKTWKENDRLLTMARDGLQIAVARKLRNNLYQIQVVDLESKSKTILDGPTELTKHVGISPNGLWLAASYSRKDPGMRLWDLRNPHEEKFVLNGHKKTIQSFAFSKDGRFLVSASWDRTVIVWDLLTKEKIAQLKGHSANVNSVAVDSINLVVASGASGRSDSSIILWDLKPLIFKETELPEAYESFDVVWKELGSAFPDQSFLAMRAIANKKDRWLKSISAKIGIATQAISPAEIATWIEQLNSPKYKIREEATEKLLAARRSADAMLRETLDNPPSTEVEYRIQRILKRSRKRPKTSFGELRRLHRAIFALEMIGSEQAQDILHTISIGHPNIDVANDAKESLERAKNKTIASD